MGVIVAIANQKGGCGKTTTAIHLSLALSERQYRVLLIDLDPQGHAGMGLGVEPSDGQPALSEILAHTPLTGVGPSMNDAINAVRPRLGVVPANLGLAGLEQQMSSTHGREERLAEHLADLTGSWDVILVDCPPNLGLLTVNALVAAREVIAPVEPAPFARHGAERLMATVDLVQERTGHRALVRMIPVMVAPRDRHAESTIAELRERYPGQVLETRIRRSILFARAAARGCGIGEVARRPRAWRDYLELGAELAQVWQEADAVLRPRFAGLRVVPGGVDFTHPDLRPEQIALAGDFNGWEPDAGVELVRGERDTWRKVLRTPPGRYEYKFVYDNRWMADPTNPRRVGNALGTQNSVIEVIEPPARREHSPGAASPDPQ